VRLEGKVALVTGGTRGIGRGIVQMLAAQGAGVTFTGRSEANGAEVEALVAAAGGRATFVRADNGNEDDVAAAVRAAVDEYGSLTVLVNNAISDDTGSGRDNHIDEIDNETVDNIMRIAVMGTFWACKYAVPEMRRAGSGSIVNISASSSKRALPHRPAYHASKGAINALTRQLAADYGPDDIRVNTIIVGFIYTGSATMTAILDDPAGRAAVERNIAVPRLGEPADIAAGVVYLASDEAKYVTGTELTIDGGALCRQALPEFDYAAMQGQ
jgi:meso-butanediol dehydrogenase / (S,S)-butanediol dehydrogenase / diacetyl reductase